MLCRFADLLRDRADPRFKRRVALLRSLFEHENLRFALGLIAMRHGSGLPVQGREGERINGLLAVTLPEAGRGAQVDFCLIGLSPNALVAQLACICGRAGGLSQMRLSPNCFALDKVRSLVPKGYC